jgi:hypothetical protein
VYDELALLGKIFVQEVDQDFQPSTTLGNKGRGFVTVTKNEKRRTYEINICKVSTDV